MHPQSVYNPLLRRQTVLPLVIGLALAFLLSQLVATPVLATYVANSHARWYTAQTSWGDPMGEPGNWTAFFVQVPIDAPPEQPLVAEYMAQDSVAATCDSGTPADPSDDWPGAVGTVVAGTASDPSASGLSSRLDTALIEGTMTLQAYSLEACGNLTPVGASWQSQFSATFVAVGGRSGWHDRWREGIPSEWISIGSMTSRERRATGSLIIGTDELAFDQSRTMLALNRLNTHESGQ
jgi:hypothetical protein